MKAAVLPFGARRTRRQVVATRLARLRSVAATSDGESTWALELSRALQDLGPIFTSFADYLATRVDLLRAADRSEFAYRHVRAPVWPSAQVARTIAEQLAADAARIAELSREPFAVTPWSQTHRARLKTGEAIYVEVVTLDTETAAADFELLPLVGPTCSDRIRAGVLSAAIADFRTQFEERLDSRRRLPLALRAADLMNRDTPLLVPVPRPELCSARVFVSDVSADVADPAQFETLSPAPDAAVRALSVWLRQAAGGAVFPVMDPRTARWCGGRLLTTGDALARLPGGCASRIVPYLLAVVGDLPDRAWKALMEDLTPIDGASAPDDVARAFQCLVPFRDDRTCDSGSDLADHAFLQWGAATKHGWIPTAALVPFYQGLWGIVAAVRQAAVGRDALAEAVRGLRVEAGVRQFDEWSRNADVMALMERQMALMLQLPQKIDRLLTVAADGSVRVQLVGASEREAAQRSRAVGAIALLLVAAAAIVLTGSVVAWPAAPVEPARSVVLLVAGGLLVWAVGRVL